MSLKIILNKYQVLFKFYADFECTLKFEGFCLKRYQDHIACSIIYKLVCVDDKFTKPIVVFKGKNAAYEFIKAILKEFQ